MSRDYDADTYNLLLVIIAAQSIMEKVNTPNANRKTSLQ